MYIYLICMCSHSSGTFYMNVVAVIIVVCVNSRTSCIQQFFLSVQKIPPSFSPFRYWKTIVLEGDVLYDVKLSKNWNV